MRSESRKSLKGGEGGSEGSRGVKYRISCCGQQLTRPGRMADATVYASMATNLFSTHEIFILCHVESKKIHEGILIITVGVLYMYVVRTHIGQGLAVGGGGRG